MQFKALQSVLWRLAGGLQVAWGHGQAGAAPGRAPHSAPRRTAPFQIVNTRSGRARGLVGFGVGVGQAQQGHVHLGLLGVGDEVANDGVGLHALAGLHVAQHGGGERRLGVVQGGQALAQVVAGRVATCSITATGQYARKRCDSF